METEKLGWWWDVSAVLIAVIADPLIDIQSVFIFDILNIKKIGLSDLYILLDY